MLGNILITKQTGAEGRICNSVINFGLKESIKVEGGLAHLPSKPGLGIDLDWDFIDNSTFKKY